MDKNLNSSQLDDDDAALKLEIWISYLLRGGVIVSGSMILIGWIMFLVTHQPSQLPTLLQGQELSGKVVPASLGEMIDELKHFEPTAVIAFGLRLLILLPVFRVFLTILLFLIQKDRIFLLFSTVVLSLLLVGVFWGKSI